MMEAVANGKIGGMANEHIASAYLNCRIQLQPLCNKIAELAEKSGLDLKDVAHSAPYSYIYDRCQRHLVEKQKENLDDTYIEHLQVSLSNLNSEASNIIAISAGAALEYILAGRKDGTYNGETPLENIEDGAKRVEYFWRVLERFGTIEPRLTHEIIWRFPGFSSFGEEERIRLVFEIYGAACSNTTVDGVDIDLLKRTLVNSFARARAEALSRDDAIPAGGSERQKP